ncbi:alkaline phosphatase family protein [Arcticibacter eurypsychrophilus]|uniref:alkaline phosphatase family protein n=1 Tax=Arcticibacter eurypsychrophilus TaxID=1434752 RepID=UPI00084DD8E6|nr:alkaline phosphatase family protein [Arcticibacter eurypsychrophilus]
MKVLFSNILILLAISCVSFTFTHDEGSPEGIKHVIIIGIDGMSVSGLQKAKTPVMDRMISQGSMVLKVRTVLPSVSSPNWASILLGAGPEQHGVTNNDWKIDDHLLEPVVFDSNNRFPSIFSIIREQIPNAETGSVYEWEGFGRLYQQSAVSYDHHFSTPDSTATEFQDYILKKKPLFAFMHLDLVDGAGHESGHGTEAYFKAISKADSLIGNVLNSIKEAGIDSNTLVIITSDHGGIGYGHGGNTPEETVVPLVFYGKGVKKGYTIKQQVYQYDVAATVAFALKVVPPYAWIGRPVKAAFEGYEEPANLWQGTLRLTAPVIYPERELYRLPGGLYVNKSAEVRMSSTEQHVSIYYTLDGTEPGANSAIYKEPFMVKQTTVVKAKAVGQDGHESQSSTAYFRIVKPNETTGLNTKFFSGDHWEELPSFNQLKSQKQWRSLEFSICRQQLLDLIPADNSCFGLVYEGYLQIDKAGKYSFYTQSDDGSKLYIDGEQVVDNDGDHGVIESMGSITLKPGKHAIKVAYFNADGGFWLETFYKGPGLTKQIIPANKLFLKQ